MRGRKKNGLIQLDSTKVIVKVIAMVNILLLFSIITLYGAGYIGITVAIFWILHASVSDWLSEYTARFMRVKILRSQYRSANHFWRTAFFYQLFWNIIFGVILFFLGSILSKQLFLNSSLSFCLWSIAPMVIIMGIVKMLQCYMTGMGMVRPVKTILVIQQILVLAASLTGAILTEEYGVKTAALLRNSDVVYIYQAFGSIVGIIAAMLVSFIISLIFMLLLRGEFNQLKNTDSNRVHENIISEITIIATAGIPRFYLKMAPIMIIVIDFLIYIRVGSGIDETASIMKIAGIIFGAVVPIVIIVVQIFRLLIIPLERPIRRSLKNQDYHVFKEYMHGIMRGNIAIILPIVILLIVISELILKIMGIAEPDMVSIQIMQVGFPMGFLISFVVSLSQIAGYIGKNTWISGITLIGIIIQSVACFFCVNTFELGLIGVYIAVYLFEIMEGIVLLTFLKRKIHFSFIYMRDIILNVLLALVTGFIIYLLYENVCSGWELHAAVFVCGVLYAVIYFLMLVFVPVLQVHDEKMMPGGSFFAFLKRFLRSDRRGEV